MPSITSRHENLRMVGPQVRVAIGLSGRYVKALSIPPEEQARPAEGLALVDTGAACTVIQRGIPEKLGLGPVGQEMVSTASNREVPCDQYDVDLLFLEQNVLLGNLVVIEAPIILQPIICLIGRDVLSKAVFVYIGHDNSFTLAF